MITVRITGGLGNQMFQFAFARTLQARGQRVLLQWHGHRTKARHNGWELDDVFEKPLSKKVRLANTSPMLAASTWVMRKTCRTREPKNTGFSEECLNVSRGYLDGYWQNERYFLEIEQTVRNDFRFIPLTGEKNTALQERIVSEPCVSIHIRRGDYVNHSELGDVCSPDYYRQALEWFDAKHPGCTPVVFSDDIEYCRTMFDGETTVFVDWNQGPDSWMDMALMSYCRHQIIANSTFSWWGAWLKTAEGTVICPANWYASDKDANNFHICPDRWVHL